MIFDKEQALKQVQLDGMNLRKVSEKLRDDKEVVLAAMDNVPYSFQFASERLQNDKQLYSRIEKDDAYYYANVNPKNGLRYDIPLLIPTDPDYYSKYVYNMKLKERSPNAFDKILRWD
jgi:hypothetical protein